MKILRGNLFGRLLYLLTQVAVHKETLKTMDRMTHASVGKRLGLPSSTAVAYLYTSVAVGGLGIPHFSTSGVNVSELPLIYFEMCHHYRLCSHLAKFFDYLFTFAETIHSKKQAFKCQTKHFHNSCDGKDLKLANDSNESQHVRISMGCIPEALYQYI